MEQEKYNEFLRQSELYYNGEPYTMDDEVWDSIKAEILTEDPTFDVFKAIGYIGNPGQSGDDANHEITFPKFGKEYIKTDMNPSQYIQFGPYKDYFAEKMAQGARWFYKYDGCSLILYYDPQTGILKDIITRSNEEVGKRRYSNFVRLVPKQIPTGIHAILCEVMVPQKFGFDYLSRNKANGLTSSKYKTGEINEVCVVVGCDVVMSRDNVDYQPEKYEERYQALKSIPNKAMNNRITFYTANPVDITKMTEYKITETVSAGSVVENLTMRVDGIVLYMDDYIEAYKAYYVDSKIAVIEEIEWNYSDLEQLIPNVRIEPIELENSAINHCPTGGVANYLKLHIGPRTRVKVARVGMTTPQIIKVVDGQQESILPTCECGHVFTEDDICVQGLLCPNPDCQRKLENRREWFKGYDRDAILKGMMSKPVEYFVKPINIHGFKAIQVNWTDEILSILLTAIEWDDVETYIKIIDRLYSFTDIQMKFVKANTKALVTVLKECLGR